MGPSLQVFASGGMRVCIECNCVWQRACAFLRGSACDRYEVRAYAWCVVRVCCRGGRQCQRSWRCMWHGEQCVPRLLSLLRLRVGALPWRGGSSLRPAGSQCGFSAPVCRGKRTVVVVFRGTASLTNVAADAKVQRCLLPAGQCPSLCLTAYCAVLSTRGV